VAMLALLPWTLGHTDVMQVSWRSWTLLFVSVLAGFAFGDTAFYEAMRRIGVARAAPIAGCHPLVTAVLAVVFLSEPVTPWLILGVVVIGIGVYLITTDQAAVSPAHGDTRNFAIGVSLSLSAAVGWALSTVMVRPALQEVDTMLASTLRMPVAGLIVLFAATRLGRVDNRKLDLRLRTLLWLLAAGILTMVSATLFLWSVQLVGAARTAALSSMSPIFSAAIAVAILGEQLTTRLAVGMGISLAGVLLVALTR
jgi:transporter family protein